MPCLVNGQPVPEEYIRDAEQWISRDPRWQAIADPAERARCVRDAAQRVAADRVLIEQTAAGDPRPIDSRIVEQEVARQKAQWGARTAFDDTHLRRRIELHFRVQRFREETSAGSTEPTAEEVEAFYNANREHFRKPEMFHVAHIVKHVNEQQAEEQAEAAINAALVELERGDPFPEVADRYSDCSGNGGDLGQFPAGHMVDEFENAIRALEPGQRTGVFTTPFGFHIAKLYARTPGEVVSLDQVRADVQRAFGFGNREQVFLAAVAKIRAAADIRWIPDEQPAKN
jgi:parvulin-like peptidyl-prolyl isomerase